MSGKVRTLLEAYLTLKRAGPGGPGPREQLTRHVYRASTSRRTVAFPGT